MIIPSYISSPFDLFDVEWVSPLYAGVLGVASKFRGNDPTSFVDYSLNNLAALLQPAAPYPVMQRQIDTQYEQPPYIPFFQSQPDRVTVYPSGTLPPELRTTRTQTNDEPTIKKCDSSNTVFDRITGRCCIGDVVNGKCRLQSDGGDLLSSSTAGNVASIFAGIPGQIIVLILLALAAILLIVLLK